MTRQVRCCRKWRRMKGLQAHAYPVTLKWDSAPCGTLIVLELRKLYRPTA